MKNFKKCLSSVLAVLLVFCMFTGSLPLPAYAEGDTETQQTEASDVTATGETEEETVATDAEPTETVQETAATETEPKETVQETVATETEPKETVQETVATETEPEETVQETVATETEPEETEDATEPTEDETAEEEEAKTAILVSPENVVCDGSEAYILFTASAEGDRFYGIGPEADAVEIPEITPENCVPEGEISLTQNDLSWTLRKTEEGGLIIQNTASGLYLTVSEGLMFFAADETEAVSGLAASETETVSGLAILEDGTLSLAGSDTETVYLQSADPELDPDQGPLFQITGEENETVFYFAEIQPEESAEEPTEPTIYSEPDYVEKIMLLAEGEPTETAFIVSPDQLILDGSKSYIIFAPCFWGGHTYAISPMGTAVGDLGLGAANCTSGTSLGQLRPGLGWALTETENGLVITNSGSYLTLSEDGSCLTVRDTETVSGLTIDSTTGRISLAEDPTKTVYLHITEREEEPYLNQPFRVTAESTDAVFYFAEIQEPEKPEPEIPYPNLLPEAGFLAEIVSPDKVYGDDQYVIFTWDESGYYAIASDAACSAALNLTADPDVGVKLSSPDPDVLWTVNNNRGLPADGGFYKYIRSCASNMYLAPEDSLLDENIRCDFYLANKNASSALIATGNNQYVTLDGGTFSLTGDPGLASRFYFARLMQEAEQNAGATTQIPEGTLLRLVDWSSIDSNKEYAIISATELNELHYALSGDGRVARSRVSNLTSNSSCPNKSVNDVYATSPCAANLGDIFYTNGQNILWTASVVGGNQATFQNTKTGLYLKLSSGEAASQTASISDDPNSTVSIVPASGACAYLTDGANHLGIWQYIAVSVQAGAKEQCAFYLAEVVSDDDKPVTKLTQDDDPSTFSFGGVYSIYQGSQHLLNGSSPVQNFILMDDGEGSFKPSSKEYSADSNYTVTYCADYDADMPIYTTPGKYTAVSLDEYEGFSDEQKAALAAIISNCYPYVTEAQFLKNLKDAGFMVTDSCSVDEILTGIQAAIYTVTNPREDGNEWGYEYSDPWAHSDYEVNKPTSYETNLSDAETDVNTVRDYLLSLASPAMAAAEDGMIEVTDRDYFAITTKIGEQTLALTYDLDSESGEYENAWYKVALKPYVPGDIRQMWYRDEAGYLYWFPNTIYEKDTPRRLCKHIEVDSSATETYNGYFTLMTDNEYGVPDTDGSGHPYTDIPVVLKNGTFQLKETNGVLQKFMDFVKTETGSDLYLYDAQNIKVFWQTDQPTRTTVYFDYNAEYWLRCDSFQEKSETPRYPDFVDYDVESTDWEVTDNGDGTYDISVTGQLNFPIRKNYDQVAVMLWCNGTLLGEVPVQPGKQDFKIWAENIPHEEEAEFWIGIQETYVKAGILVPQNPGWQIQVGATYNTTMRQIHELTTSIPAKKVWDDNLDHSGDTVELCLMENGKETSYRLTLSADNNWQGVFRHVPYLRWTNEDGYGKPIPLDSHEYTIKELNVKPGYIPKYGILEPTVLKPGKSYPVQVVFTPEGDNLDPALKDKTFALDMEGFINEYTPEKPSQKFFLNGDTLVAKAAEKLQCFKFEKSKTDGKYNIIYDVGPDGTKLYFPKDLSLPTEDKSNALDVTFLNFIGGAELKELPTDSFQPLVRLLNVCEDGQATNMVFNYNDQIVQYDAESETPKFAIYCCEDQYLAIPDGKTSTYYTQLEPCDGVSGEYMLCYDDKGTRLYMSQTNSGTARFMEGKENALHFVLAETISTDGSGDTMTVTNVPVPTASLEVSKTVSGKGADEEKEFSFTVTLSEKSVNGTYGGMTFTDGVATFTLKDGEKKTATGLPAGITYEVVESDNAGYTVKVNGKEVTDAKASGTLVQDTTAKAAFNNDKPEDPPKPTKPPKPEKPKKPRRHSGWLPNTGDTSNIELWLGVTGASLVAMIVLLFVWNKKKRK